MAQQNQINSNLHDNVINETIKQLNNVEFDIYSNPGQSRNAGIGDNYPDIIMTEKGNNKVKFIIEVETEDTVNIYEANKQWKKYANEIDATFYLLIPEKNRNAAQILCNKVGINVRFATFSINSSNVISIKFE